MRSKLFFGAFVVGATLFGAACGSSARTGTSPTDPGTAMIGMDHSSTTSGSSTPDSTSMAGMDPSSLMASGSMAMSDTPPAVGLTLSVALRTFESNKAATLSFHVLAQDGTPVTSYQTEQTKELHLILVRSDLTGYQHLHPTRAVDGTWALPVTFANGGTYRMVADFVPVLGGVATGRTSITTELAVSGTSRDTPLPAPAPTSTVDGYTVTISGNVSSTTEASVTFGIVDQAGKPAALEPYLGSYGHLVAFAQNDLAYTHIHPNTADQSNGKLEFLGQVAAPGAHRLFLQFASGGSVHTAAFTVEVA